MAGIAERWCAWHKPAPIMFTHYGDGRKKVTRTHGICPRCLPRVMAELEAKMHKPGMVTFPARRAGKTAIQAEMMKRKLEDRNE